MGNLTGNASIVTSGLTKVFGSATVVQDVSLQVNEGEFFGFLGPNGAGKSTTIKMLCGLLRPSAGTIHIAGHDLAREPLAVKKIMGVLPEDANLYERLSAEEFLMFSAQMYGLPREEARRRVHDLLELMELAAEKKKLIVDFSMGMKKKTALAAALIHRPRVLFLDEPFNGIDPISMRGIRNVLHQLTEKGTTIFFSSHVMEVVERLCTRVAIINAGRIVGVGALAELRAMAEAGGDSTLEDIFLKYVNARVDDESLSWI
ncbi:MAG TPA: ABC transporter ATP-binding protein [Armatimonadota bacterium]|jgi:ABC-2 type transport system ATP-binding protein